MNLTTNGSSRDFTVGATNNRITNHNTQYDPAGNLTDIRLDGVNYDHTFDALNMMKAYQSSAGHAEVYIYTADDERLAKVDFSGSPIVATWTLRDLGGRVLRVFKQTWGEGWEWERDYVHRGAQILSTVEPDGAGEKVLHMHLDHLGTPRQITDSGGAEVAYHAYYPFGAELTNEAQNEISLKFTGHERDSGGLDYMHARHCGPEIGRFVSVDPIDSAKLPFSVSWNKYVYTVNNPVRFTDPTGEDNFDVINGFLNAVASNIFLGAGRIESSNDDFTQGQLAGDYFSLALSTMEIGAGTNIATGGVACEVGTGGVCTAAAVPAIATGAVLVTHGVASGAVATENIANADNRFSSGGGKTGRKSNADRVSVAQEKIKALKKEKAQAKTKKEKEKIQNMIDHTRRNLRNSEEHARRAQR